MKTSTAYAFTLVGLLVLVSSVCVADVTACRAMLVSSLKDFPQYARAGMKAEYDSMSDAEALKNCREIEAYAANPEKVQHMLDETREQGIEMAERLNEISKQMKSGTVDSALMERHQREASKMLEDLEEEHREITGEEMGFED